MLSPRDFSIVVAVSLCVSFLAESAQAKAKITTPIPFRSVRVATIGTMPFQLPNGSRVDITADLQSMLNTAITESSPFLPTLTQTFDDGRHPTDAPDTRDPYCDTRLELRAAVTTLEMNVAEFGVKFGYKPTGETSVLKGINGKANVKIGTVAMDFGIWQCVAGECAQLIASTATQATAQVGLSAEIDFGLITTGPEFIYNTPIGAALRKIMHDGMKKLSKAPRLSKLAWKTRVLETFPGSAQIFFDGGTQQGLKKNQAFEVYRIREMPEGCPVYRPIALVHSVSVGAISTIATVKESYDSRGVEVGDWILVHEVK